MATPIAAATSTRPAAANGHQPAPVPPAPSVGLVTATGSAAGGDCAAFACTVAVALL